MKRHVPSCDGADDHPIEVYRINNAWVGQATRQRADVIGIRQGEDLIVFEPDQVAALALALLETVRELEIAPCDTQ